MCPHAELLLGRVDRRSTRTPLVDGADARRRRSTSRYEQLVVALGSVVRVRCPIPGLAEHGLGFKALADAIQLRNHVLRSSRSADAALDDASRRAGT